MLLLWICPFIFHFERLQKHLTTWTETVEKSPLSVELRMIVIIYKCIRVLKVLVIIWRSIFFFFFFNRFFIVLIIKTSIIIIIAVIFLKFRNSNVFIFSSFLSNKYCKCECVCVCVFSRTMIVYFINDTKSNFLYLRWIPCWYLNVICSKIMGVLRFPTHNANIISTQSTLHT